MTDLETIYAKLPNIQCRGLCRDQCSVIPASELEFRAMAERGFDLREAGRSFMAGGPSRCAALSPLGTCRAYDVRPLICRLYGVAEGLECSYGCQPDWLLTRAQVRVLLHEAECLSIRETGKARRLGGLDEIAHPEAT